MQMCYGCMGQLDDDINICPVCGYDSDTPPVYDDCLYPGTAVSDRYIIGKAIGRGGFGITYIAFDNDTGKRVVIKEYLPEGFAKREFGKNTVSPAGDEEKFKTGMKNAIDCSNAISGYDYLESVEKYIDCVRENGTIYIVREYFDGVTIREYVEKNGSFGYQRAVETIIPVLRSLSGLHEKGFIHGNINPDSIIMCSSGAVKLVDLGLRAESPYALRTGFAPGEQYENTSEITEAADVYSVCAVIYYMLTGQVPADSRLRGAANDKFVPLCGTGFIPASVEDMLMKGMSVNVSDRTVSADDVADALIMRKKTERLSESDDSESEENTEETETEDTLSPRERKKEIRKKRFRRFLKKHPAVVGFAGTVVVLLIALAVLIVVIKVNENKKPDPTETTGISIAEDIPDSSVIFTPTQATGKYKQFLDADDFKEKYPLIYAVRTHDIEFCPEGSDIPKDITTFDYASVSQYYDYDLDGDGTNELLYVVRFDSSQRYVSAYIFDLDKDGNVFEGGSIEYNSDCVENLCLCDEKTNSRAYYYFLRYSGNAYGGKYQNDLSFECLYYDGKELQIVASGGQNILIMGQNGPSPLGAYCFTGSTSETAGNIWNITNPVAVQSLYPFTDGEHVGAEGGYTVVDEESYDRIWSRYVISSDKKCELRKNLSAEADGPVAFSVSFNGPKTGSDVEMTWKIKGEETPFLYPGDGREIHWSGEMSADDFGAGITVELYVGEDRYSSVQIALDTENNPVYHYGETELAYLPDVKGKLSAVAQAELRLAGFTDVKVTAGSAVGLKNLSNLGKIERVSPETGKFYPADTQIILYRYV